MGQEMLELDLLNSSVTSPSDFETSEDVPSEHINDRVLHFVRFLYKWDSALQYCNLNAIV
jgi:hypothetical protein